MTSVNNLCNLRHLRINPDHIERFNARNVCSPLLQPTPIPLITTERLAEVRQFYVDQLQFDVVFEASWFLLVAGPGPRSPLIAFMHPSHPSSPPGPEAFTGNGMIWTLQVEDAAATYAEVQKTGLKVHYQLTDEPWGQRRFMLRDPAGLLIDVVEQTAPQEGFWDRYMGSAGSVAR